jgi:hypothetical protein
MAGSNDITDPCHQLWIEHQALKVIVSENNVRIEGHLRRFSEHLAMEEQSFRDIKGALADLSREVQQIHLDMVSLKKDTKAEIKADLEQCKDQLGQRMDRHVTKHEVRLVWFVVTTLVGAGLWIFSNMPKQDTSAQMERIHQTHQELLSELKKRKP